RCQGDGSSPMRPLGGSGLGSCGRLAIVGVQGSPADASFLGPERDERRTRSPAPASAIASAASAIGSTGRLPELVAGAPGGGAADAGPLAEAAALALLATGAPLATGAALPLQPGGIGPAGAGCGPTAFGTVAPSSANQPASKALTPMPIA